ncbi:MAG: HAD-IB family hydrolase [Pseudomonadota bacterium]|nr:HAD-IB family hydrolase [Pseudomonadota bacterium]
MNLCLFDLDDTLLPLDSDHAWGEFVISLGWVDEPSFRCGNDAFFAQYKAGKLDVHAYIEFATRPLRERSSDQLAAAHRQFMQGIIEPQLRESARDLVRSHQASGDLVALVTATNDFVTAPIAAAFGIPSLIAVQLERDARGSITGRIRGTPSYREGKVQRVEEWLGAQGVSWGDCERVTVYSDSLNDLPLLEKATDPVATNPTPALLSVATQRGWRTLNLFT